MESRWCEGTGGEGGTLAEDRNLANPDLDEIDTTRSLFSGFMCLATKHPLPDW